MISDDFDNNKSDNYLHKISSKQETFLAVTGILLWITIGLSIANIYFFVETISYNNDIQHAINIFNNISSELFEYFKNNDNQTSTDCYSFDGKEFVIKSPMVLSPNAKTKIQFPTGLKLPGMTILPNEIDLYGSILFNNNMYEINGWASNFKSLIQASMNSNFIGKPGYTEIGYLTSSSSSASCAGLKSTTLGDNNYPFPGVYINSLNGYQLCICTSNWLKRSNSDVIGSPLRLALSGSSSYDTAGEYCVPLY